MKGQLRGGAQQLVLLTGLSGSGKSTILRAFEDMGFYCVDNLPVDLIPMFAEMHSQSVGEYGRAALLVDAREGAQLKKLPLLYRHLRKDHPLTLVYVDASEEALLRRYSETRRPHPLSQDRSVREGLRRERTLMEPIKKVAGLVIDTSKFNVHELRRFVMERFKNPDRRPLLISVVSFGYRFGVPGDADLVFDVRFLPNPYFVPKLRAFSGKDPHVARFLRSFPQTRGFLRRLEGLLLYLLPQFIREGKSYLTIGIGCTGGRHRSVTLAEALAKDLTRRGYAAKAAHRDIDK